MDIRTQLIQTRKNLQYEIRRALDCRSNQEKIDLVNEWKEKYHPIFVKELIRVAKNKTVAYDILKWDVEQM